MSCFTTCSSRGKNRCISNLLNGLLLSHCGLLLPITIIVCLVSC